MVSVIIPAYNAEAFIERAVRSVLVQTERNIELIVVNDGSKDATRKILEKLAEKDNRIKLINVENGGVSKARNIGIDNASGEYIMFLDADDELYPDALEKMEACIENTGADICRALACRINTGETKPISRTDERTQKWSAYVGIQKVIEDHPATYAVWAKLYRREKLAKVRFPEGIRSHEDSFFVFSCFFNGLSMVLLDYVVYCYHVTEGSTSRSGFNEKMFDIIALAEQKVRLINSKYPELQKQSINILVKAHMALLSNLCKYRGRKYATQERSSIRFLRENKAVFIPISKGNKKWHWILTHCLYYPYKLAYRIKHFISVTQ